MKVALVTGGTRGIGFGIAARLGAERFDLAVCGVRARDEVAGPLRGLEATGAKVLYVEADIGAREARERLVSAVRSEFGRLDVLVNNAGMAPRRRADVLEARPAKRASRRSCGPTCRAPTSSPRRARGG